MTAKTDTKKDAAAKAEVPTFTFEDAPVPTQTRKSTAVNPLLEACKGIAETMGEDTTDAKGVLIPARSKTAKTVNAATDAQAKQIKRWLALAGKELAVTFRSVVEKNDGKQTVTFWAVKRIEHKEARKTAAAKK